MADHKREMDIAAQLRLTAEHSRSKGPLLLEAAEVIEAMAFRLAALRDELDKAKEQNESLAKRLDQDNDEIADRIMHDMGFLFLDPEKYTGDEQRERAWIQKYRGLEAICKRSREELELRQMERAWKRFRAAVVPKWIIRLIERLNPE